MNNELPDDRPATDSALKSLHRELARNLTATLKGDTQPLPASFIQEIRLLLVDNGIDVESMKTAQGFTKLTIPLETFDDKPVRFSSLPLESFDDVTGEAH